jgi:TIR domain-containing protein
LSNHKALKSDILDSSKTSGCEFKLVQLQNSKTDKVLTLHALPKSYTFGGDAQVADFLYFLGLHRGSCSFFKQACLSTRVSDDFDLQPFSKDFSSAFSKFAAACKLLRPCGIVLPKPESLAVFSNKPTSSEPGFISMGGGDGHRGNESQRRKTSDDNYFDYVFTWLVRDQEKGWVTHYKPKNPAAFREVMEFIGFESFQECPEFEFEHCYWRFLRASKKTPGAYDNGAAQAHDYFDKTSGQFSEALIGIQNANSMIAPYGLHLWDPPATISSNEPDKKNKEIHAAVDTAPTCFISYSHDDEDHKRWVRNLAEDLRANGVNVTIDQWDLGLTKDMTLYMETSVRESRFVLMVLTPNYTEKANKRQGGVGYESAIISSELFGQYAEGKFVPVKRSGSEKPTFVGSKIYADFSDDSKYQESLEELLRHIYSSPKYPKPQLGPRPKF